MTNRGVVRVLEDGTRVYASYHRYKPVPPEKRKYGVNKPDDPRAVRFHGKWFLPLPLLVGSDRVMPETRPDTDAYDHMATNILCRCVPCMRPQAKRWRQKWLRDQAKLDRH